MDIIRLSSPTGTSDIFLNADFSDIREKFSGRKIIFLTDENLFPLYPYLFDAGEVIVIPAGEQEKNISRAEYIYHELLKFNADRASWLVAVGGGVISDLAGFVATTYLRGMQLMMVPTSLLAMVDAAIGGKNGVNLGEYKNMVGTFRQPELILVAPGFLNTLPPEELTSGMAEVIKYGLIHDPVILDLLENAKVEDLFAANDLIRKLIVRSIRAKVEIVEQDVADHGIRRYLNFGHTFGHAVERKYQLSHGVAVALGMCVALKLSVEQNLLNEEILDVTCRLLRRFNLIPDIQPRTQEILDAMAVDKKVREGKWVFVFLEAPGQPVVRNIEPEDFAAFLDTLVKDSFYEKLHSHR